MFHPLLEGRIAYGRNRLVYSDGLVTADLAPWQSLLKVGYAACGHFCAIQKHSSQPTHASQMNQARICHRRLGEAQCVQNSKSPELFDARFIKVRVIQ